jgi:hypothetical protein
MKFTNAVAAAALTCFLGSTGSAAVLYSENFDVNATSNWTVNEPASPTDKIVDFFYDYAAVGVPAAPSGSTTRGLKMTANNSAAIFSGFSVSPTGKNFNGNYQLSFDLWQNYVGPLGAGGNGSTQLSMFGVGTAGTVAVTPSSTKESIAFAATLDGGSGTDYRAYSSAATTSYPAGDAVYFATGAANNNNSNSYYSGFTAQAAPAAQVALYTGQTLATDVGELGFKWRRVVIDVENNVATWSVDGLPMAKVNMTGLTIGGGNIFFGHSDTNATSSNDPNDTLLNVTLIDNVQVTGVPEPGSFAMMAAAVSCLMAIRRRPTV